MQHSLDDCFNPIINQIKGSPTPMCQLDLKLLTFFSIMAQNRGVTKAQLKRELYQLGRDLFNIDLQIQHIKQGQQQGNIATLE